MKSKSRQRQRDKRIGKSKYFIRVYFFYYNATHKTLPQKRRAIGRMLFLYK